MHPRVLVTAALALITITVGCGPSAPRQAEATGGCEIGQCPGGCCLDGRCQPGDSMSACGVPGGICSACLPGSRCLEGQCSFVRSLCNLVQGCDGCCLDGECRPGIFDDACGVRGDPCQPCASSQRCRDGYCQTVGRGAPLGDPRPQREPWLDKVPQPRLPGEPWP